MSEQYWTKNEKNILNTAQSYAELRIAAEKVLSRMPRPRAQMCGPISTGGAGSVEANIKRFDDAITKLEAKGVSVFNQMPFERPMQKIKEKFEVEGYDTDILTDFYLPIFEGGYVDVLYFLPDWESSTGATWEHKQAKRIGIEIVYL